MSSYIQESSTALAWAKRRELQEYKHRNRRHWALLAARLWTAVWRPSMCRCATRASWTRSQPGTWRPSPRCRCGTSSPATPSSRLPLGVLLSRSSSVLKSDYSDSSMIANAEKCAIGEREGSFLSSFCLLVWRHVVDWLTNIGIVYRQSLISREWMFIYYILHGCGNQIACALSRLSKLANRQNEKTNVCRKLFFFGKIRMRREKSMPHDKKQLQKSLPI